MVNAEALRDAWLALADGYILAGNRNALTAYRSAWLATNPASAAVEVSALDAQGDISIDPENKSSPVPTAVLTDPVLLWPDAYQPIYFKAVTNPNPMETNTGYAVDLGFTISTEGRAKRIKVLKKNVPNREVRWTRTLVLNSRFRPALRNGIPEEVEYSLRQDFIPRPENDAATPAPDNSSTNLPSGITLSPAP